MRPRLLLLALLASPAAAQDAWPTRGGSGLLTLPDAATLAPGNAILAVSLDNRDRDPLGLDLLDGSLLGTIGVSRRTELYASVVLSRVAALPEPPPLPPPPLDLIVAPGAAAPTRPYYAIYPETPYVNKRGSARFDAWVPGEARLGLKRRLGDAAGWRPALAAGLDLELPLSRRLPQLQSGSGTGGWNAGGRLVADWSWERNRLIATLAYLRTGAAHLGDRVIETAPGGTTVSDQPLELADRLELALGYRRPLGTRLAIVAEAARVLDVGKRTPVTDAAPPLDVLAGAQFRWGRARFSAALRYHANAADSGRLRPSPLAGLVELTGVGAEELAGYLDGVGAAGALPYLREGAQRLIATDARQPLPEGARRMPASYRIRSEHQVGFVVTWAWAF